MVGLVVFCLIMMLTCGFIYRRTGNEGYRYAAIASALLSIFWAVVALLPLIA